MTGSPFVIPEGQCDARTAIHDDGAKPAANLICTMRSGHPGRLHFDAIDGIWWIRDDEPPRDGEP